MVNIVGVRFKKAGKIYYFDPLELDLSLDDAVIVETTRGVELGVVSMDMRAVTDTEVVAPLKPVLRKATPEDLERHRRNLAKEKEAMTLCREKITAHGLDMKLVDVEFTFDQNKVIFYFTADGRVDFRDLVKDLASVFRTRIELRQIGVRDEAKMKSGIGPCGRVLCCSSFLADFTSVSIKMAKEQNLSLNPTKISGICGRLMCCLKYEQETYEEIRKRLPRYGSIVNTPMGRGEVISNNTIKEQIKVKIYGDGDDVIEYFNIADCEMIKGSYEDNAGKRDKATGEGGETESSSKENQPRQKQGRDKSRNRDKEKQSSPEAKGDAQDNAIAGEVLQTESAIKTEAEGMTQVQVGSEVLVQTEVPVKSESEFRSEAEVREEAEVRAVADADGMTEAEKKSEAVGAAPWSDPAGIGSVAETKDEALADPRNDTAGEAAADQGSGPMTEQKIDAVKPIPESPGDPDRIKPDQAIE